MREEKQAWNPAILLGKMLGKQWLSFRVKADEAYLVGKGLAPVAAYLDVPGIIRVAQVKYCNSFLSSESIKK